MADTEPGISRSEFIRNIPSALKSVLQPPGLAQLNGEGQVVSLRQLLKINHLLQDTGAYQKLADVFGIEELEESSVAIVPLPGIGKSTRLVIGNGEDHDLVLQRTEDTRLRDAPDSEFIWSIGLNGRYDFGEVGAGRVLRVDGEPVAGILQGETQGSTRRLIFILFPGDVHVQDDSVELREAIFPRLETVEV